MEDESKPVNEYKMDCEKFIWSTFARSPEEAEAHFRSNLALLMRKGGPSELRSRAARALRMKTLVEVD